MLACAMFCHSSCTAAGSPATLQGNGFIPIMFLDIIDNKFANTNIWILGWQQEIGRTGKNVLTYPCCMRCCHTPMMPVLSATTWSLTCGYTWGRTISSKYLCAVRSSWMSKPACNCYWHIPIHRWIYLQKHCFEQCTHSKGAHDDKWSAFFADFTPSL